MSSVHHLTLTLSNSRSVELADLSLSLLALANEYRRFCVLHGDIPDSRLYIVEIKPGSIIAELAALAESALPFFNHLNSVIAFIQALKHQIEALLADKPEAPQDAETLKNLREFVEPVVKDSASVWNIQAETVNITVTNLQAGALQNKINRRLAAMPATVSGIHEQVVLSFTQAKVSPNTGNRGMIESLYPGAVKTIFANDMIHQSMVMGEDNPLGTAYLVDVAVETVNQRPVLYKIIAFYERL